MKQLRSLSLFSAVVFVLALSLAVSAPAAPGGRAVPPPPPAAASPAPPDHPQIRDAITALQNAKSHLESAKKDFGGHKSEAIRAVNHAIQQLEICLKYD